MTRPLLTLLAALWLVLPSPTRADENYLAIQKDCTYTCQGQKRTILQDVVCITPAQLAAIQRDLEMCQAENTSYSSSATLAAQKLADATLKVQELEALVADLRARLDAQAATISELRNKLWVVGLASGLAGGAIGGTAAGLIMHYGSR